MEIREKVVIFRNGKINLGTKQFPMKKAEKHLKND